MNMASKIRGVTRGASVLFPLEPKVDESIRGYLARTADWNCFDSRTDLLRLAGLTYVRRDLSDRIAGEISAMSAVLGIRSTSLRRILNPVVDGNHEVLDYFGMPFQRRRLEVKGRRLSPVSLRASVHHRARWQIKQLSFCPESWEQLIETCPSEACGRPLRWADCLEIDRCEHCQFDLKAAEGHSVPMDLREPLGFVADLLHPSPETRGEALSRLPAPLSELPANEVFELLCVVARATTPDHLNPKSGAFDNWYLARATQALLDYPKTFDQIAMENASATDGTPPLHLRLRLRSREKSLLQRSLIHGFMDRAQSIHSEATPVSRPRRERDGLIYLRPAQWLGVELPDFKKIVAAGMVSPASGRLRLVRRVRLSELQPINIALRRRLPVSEFVQSYGLPRAGVEQLVSLSMLHQCEEPVVRLLYPSFQLDRVSVLQFVDRISEFLAPPLPESVALEDLFHGIGGQEKPWGAMLRAALAGQIPGGLGLEYEAKLRFERLTIPRQFALEILAGRYPEMLQVPDRCAQLGDQADLTLREAQRYLNCFRRDLDWLVANGHLKKLEHGQVVRRRSVEDLGRALISDREISWRWRISSTLR